MKDYYEVLGLSPQASKDDIKERFRFLSHALHPDKFATSSQRKQADELFKTTSEAYQMLSVNERRILYDRRRNLDIRFSDVKNNHAEGIKGSASIIEKLKNLQKRYLLGFGILAIIIAGAIINLSSRGRSSKAGFLPIPASTSVAVAKNSFPGIQDVLSINRNAFDTEIEFQKHQQEVVKTFNNGAEHRNPNYQAATAKLNIEDLDIKSGKLPLFINWKFRTKQLDKEGYIIVTGDKAEALLKEGNQKPIYVYLDIVEGTLKISKILLIGLEEEMEVSFLPAGTVRCDSVSGMEFVWIPSGSITMGSSITDKDGHGSEKPAHEVFINGFWMGKYEVTQAQWKRIMEQNNSKSNNEQSTQDTSNYPVMNFKEEFLVRLNKRSSGDIYRLPSEAEWEYAARAGSNGQYSFGNDTSKLDEYAWFSQNSGGVVYPVGQLKPNKWGLYDIHGNVSELCEDAWHPNYDNAPIDGSVWQGGHKTFKVLRGGGIEDPPIFLRSASRSVSERNNDSQFHAGGFRLVRTSGLLE